ncbi:hypothetical protein [Candidatus Nitrosocosmicus franklandus]|uniref:Uncharacterized protein n=1 Tax=Candidatus Nitrosocosmicus franklandianus TaxID=1798806 RepID=A0A484I861_9ARCH|nr:hypothetical protein [Candidatus Nitrosocosmicus franklandus]VFJ12933.1 protein of unknown function [Candidatus Nitrosocosmicus franklandus]
MNEYHLSILFVTMITLLALSISSQTPAHSFLNPDIETIKSLLNFNDSIV